MERVTFRQFLGRTVKYENLPVQVSPALRRGAWISWPVLVLTGLWFYYLPGGEVLRTEGFFRWTRGWQAGTWSFVEQNRIPFLAVNLGVLALAVLLLALTRGYRLAPIGLHAALFILVVYAALSTLFALFLLLPVLANLIAWIVIIAFIIASGIFGTMLLLAIMRR